jgi:beta-1,4-mannosyl-glycoprotein beta-1,4-N-acetylglucosaminyltransferase
MKILDCFIFNDENEILKIRLNTLSPYVDKFIIVESLINHKGKRKKKNFNINLFKKFKKKICYLLIKNIPKNYSSWQIENFQRNYISNGLKKFSKEDIVIISDVDEIPNLKDVQFSKIKNNYYAFEQDHFFYKLNLKLKEKWIGSKMCKLKDLKSPQWLRSLKMHKKYSVSSCLSYN